MSAFPSLPLFTDAFIADTGHLTAQETGAYLLLLMVAWRSPGCSLPDDDRKLAKWARVDARTWVRIKPAIMEFWALEAGVWSQKRLTQEREIVSKRAEVARENGKHGGRPKSLENLPAANQVGYAGVTQKKAPNPNPSEEKKEKEDKPLSPKSDAKGTFLPRGWRPSDEGRAKAVELLGLERARLEHGKFVNFWAGKSGANARKRDWDATWLYWIANAAERQPTPQRGHNAEDRSATAAAQRLLEQSRILDDIERRERPVLQIVGPGSSDDADGLLPQGRCGEPGNLLRFRS